MLIEEPNRIKNLLKDYNGIWMIAGGWAIDLYLDKHTREHKDIEIAIPRNEQLKLKSYLKDWSFQYVSNGIFYTWGEGRILEQPIHEIHGKSKESTIEILLNEIDNTTWKFRRNMEISYPFNKLMLTSAQQIPILCPEIVLLYKAKINKEKDKLDLLNSIDNMNQEALKWLKESIIKTHGNNHEWIIIINNRYYANI